MSGLDVTLLLLIAGLVIWEIRQEAGRSLLDVTVTALVLHLTHIYAAPLTASLGWDALPGGNISPLATALLFGTLWPLGLAVSWYFHRQTRWSMDHFDGAFGFVFGLAMAVMVGHVVTDVAADMAIIKHGRLPDAVAKSAIVDELRSFRTYHELVNALRTTE
jgi:hypothetical protein